MCHLECAQSLYKSVIVALSLSTCQVRPRNVRRQLNSVSELGGARSSLGYLAFCVCSQPSRVRFRRHCVSISDKLWQKLFESPKFGLMFLEPAVDTDCKMQELAGAAQVLSCAVLHRYDSLRSGFCCNRFGAFDNPSHMQFIPMLDGIVCLWILLGSMLSRKIIQQSLLCILFFSITFTNLHMKVFRNLS